MGQTPQNELKIESKKVHLKVLNLNFSFRRYTCCGTCRKLRFIKLASFRTEKI